MRLQTDLEFKQNQIKKLNNELDVEMFHTKVHRGKAFAAEQKIREFKKNLLRSNRFEKYRKNRIKPNDLIKKGGQNMNETIWIFQIMNLYKKLNFYQKINFLLPA